MLKLDCPNDFYKENCPFLALEKNRLRTDGPTDGPTDGQTHPHIEMGGPI